MVEKERDALDIVFHALSDRTRRGMLARLCDGALSIGDLAAPYAMSFAGAAKHVKVLERAGLVRREVRGRTHLCRLEAARLAEAQAWLEHYERFWSRRLDRLETLLAAEDAPAAAQRDTPARSAPSRNRERTDDVR
ncbi:metalloregulator ArsR/SmtB family transcription factor [Aquibium sp. A9E412]|uniref:ArsR/SmtB family transcription factor n=1 Tax=Aquibium sp. A9E412 TaxID=2976767 RepID=UPI0025B1820D|nr:metalloregulator ArsR/SmtB family transcription factor [Aquibium sp. A9E412]MDN2566431.1 metalloregulator ArsR/SmtB family transcription factor [Aquibium sp. A9E412]